MVQYIRYSGEEDFRFPALKHRLSPFKRYKYTGRGRRISVEGIFVYKTSHPQKNPKKYLGFLDPAEEYNLLKLKPPEKEQYKIFCSIPTNLISKEKLLSKPNVRLSGLVDIQQDNASSKILLVEEIEILPIEYRAVGSPAFLNLDEMFSFLYSRNPEIYEHGPLMLLASLIGSERVSQYFPEETPGCGINIGTSSEDVRGKPAAGVVTASMRRQLGNFIKEVNIGPINKLCNQLKWNRFISLKEPKILSRTLETRNEVDWNLISDISAMNKPRLSEFTASDINLVFDPNLFPRKLSREDLKNLRQTLLFAKSTPALSYGENIVGRIEMKTEDLVKELARVVDYAPFLFRYRFEPLCDAFLKGNHLEDYIIGGEINVEKRDVDDFFRRVKDAALDFAEYAQDHIETTAYGKVIDTIKDHRARSLYTELLVKGGLSAEHMVSYLMERYNTTEEKAKSIVEDLVEAEPVLVVKKQGLYNPVYS